MLLKCTFIKCTLRWRLSTVELETLRQFHRWYGPATQNAVFDMVSTLGECCRQLVVTLCFVVHVLGFIYLILQVQGGPKKVDHF